MGRSVCLSRRRSHRAVRLGSRSGGGAGWEQNASPTSRSPGSPGSLDGDVASDLLECAHRGRVEGVRVCSAVGAVAALAAHQHVEVSGERSDVLVGNEPAIAAASSACSVHLRRCSNPPSASGRAVLACHCPSDLINSMPWPATTVRTNTRSQPSMAALPVAAGRAGSVGICGACGPSARLMANFPLAARGCSFLNPARLSLLRCFSDPVGRTLENPLQDGPRIVPQQQRQTTRAAVPTQPAPPEQRCGSPRPQFGSSPWRWHAPSSTWQRTVSPEPPARRPQRPLRMASTPRPWAQRVRDAAGQRNQAAHG